jgi:hypothetical protein
VFFDFGAGSLCLELVVAGFDANFDVVHRNSPFLKPRLARK